MNDDMIINIYGAVAIALMFLAVYSTRDGTSEALVKIMAAAMWPVSVPVFLIFFILFQMGVIGDEEHD